MRMYDIVEKKRDGKELSNKEITYFIDGYTEGHIPDYQVSALLMAIYFQGMTKEEQTNLTLAMVNSGETIDLSAIKGVKVDKHSTGGVGDTTTIILAPLVASLGVPVAKMSGRGLGHTGGTLDKLESIPGFHTEISNEDFIKFVNKNKVAVIGQTGNLTPADKQIYSLRDVTATINSIPLIASSIMSKKIASGTDAIVLDVKTGAGAFMKDYEDAKALAEAMVSIGQEAGKKSMAVISDMSQPLGNAIGNALEIKEAINTLQGKGPDDLTDLCLTLGSQMVYLSNQAGSLEEAREQLKENLMNGKALEHFKLFIESQGGDPRVANEPNLLPETAYKFELLAPSSGFITNIEANNVGRAAMMLGAGRATKDSVIDLAVGIELHKKVGDKIEVGESLLSIHANDEEIDHIKEKLLASIHIDSEAIKPPTLIHKSITI